MSNLKFNIADLRAGDVFSEESHYRFVEKKSNGYEFLHTGSNQTVTLNEKYVTDLLVTADQYMSEQEVGKEDKYWTEKQITDAISKGDLPADTKVRVGDVRVKGIRSIWAEIYSKKVFTVFFNKQTKDLSKKAFDQLKNKQLQEALDKIEKAYTGKKGVAKTAELVIKEIIDNPILPIVPGELRKLRGYKTQFSSINGIYDVIDLDITVGDPTRKVNVNEITELISDGVRYIVK